MGEKCTVFLGFSCYDGGKKPYDFFFFRNLSSGRYRPPYIQKLAKSYVRGAVQPPKFDFIPIKLLTLYRVTGWLWGKKNVKNLRGTNIWLDPEYHVRPPKCKGGLRKGEKPRIGIAIFVTSLLSFFSLLRYSRPVGGERMVFDQ